MNIEQYLAGAAVIYSHDKARSNLENLSEDEILKIYEATAPIEKRRQKISRDLWMGSVSLLILSPLALYSHDKYDIGLEYAIGLFSAGIILGLLSLIKYRPNENTERAYASLRLLNERNIEHSNVIS